MRKTQIHLEEVTRVARVSLLIAAAGAIFAALVAVVGGLPLTAILALGTLALCVGTLSGGFGLAALLATTGSGAGRDRSVPSAPGRPQLRVPQPR